MPATTPRYKLPYPTQTDPVWQGATAIQNLAQRLETILAAANIPTTAAARDDSDARP